MHQSLGIPHFCIDWNGPWNVTEKTETSQAKTGEQKRSWILTIDIPGEIFWSQLCCPLNWIKSPQCNEENGIAKTSLEFQEFSQLLKKKKEDKYISITALIIYLLNLCLPHTYKHIFCIIYVVSCKFMIFVGTHLPVLFKYISKCICWGTFCRAYSTHCKLKPTDFD